MTSTPSCGNASPSSNGTGTRARPWPHHLRRGLRGRRPGQRGTRPIPGPRPHHAPPPAGCAGQPRPAPGQADQTKGTTVPQTLLALVALLASVAAIVWGAETFAEHLTDASTRLGVSTFALALPAGAVLLADYPSSSSLSLPASKRRCRRHRRLRRRSAWATAASSCTLPDRSSKRRSRRPRSWCQTRHGPASWGRHGVAAGQIATRPPARIRRGAAGPAPRMRAAGHVAATVWPRTVARCRRRPSAGVSRGCPWRCRTRRPGRGPSWR